MKKQSVLEMIFLAATVMTAPVVFVVLEIRYHFMALCFQMAWCVPICVIALIILCILLSFVTYRKNLLTRQSERDMQQEAEQFFVGDFGPATQNDILILDKAGSLEMEQEDLFAIAANEDGAVGP